MKIVIKKLFSNKKLPLILSIFLALFIAFKIFFFGSYEYLTSLIIDDSLYYPIIAKNIASGNGSTFDNITITNGYHPLWCWINIPFSLISNDRDTLLILFKDLLVCVVLSMLVIWYFLLKKVGINEYGRAFFILFMGGSYWWSIKVYYSGMETALVTLFIGLTLIYFINLSKNSNLKYTILLGICITLTFFSRLDSIFFIIALYLYGIIYQRKIVKELVISGIIFTGTSVPYLLWNKLEFGSFIPISGIKKSINIENSLSYNLKMFKIYLYDEIKRMSDFINLYILVVFILLLMILMYFLIKMMKSKNINIFGRTSSVFTAVYFGAFIHFLYNIFFMTQITVNWYQYLIYLSIFILLSVFVDNISKSFSKGDKLIRLSYLVLFILMLLMIDFGFKKYPRTPKVETINVALFAKGNTKDDAIFIMSDPGIFRYVSERKTIAGNGLIGNREIMELSSKGKKDQIIKNYNVGFIVEIFSQEEIEKIDLIPKYKSKKFLYGGKECCICIFDALEYLIITK